MRRARLEGRHIGRRPVDVDRAAVIRERDRGQSLSQIATTHRVSRATVSRIIKLAQPLAVPSILLKIECSKGVPQGTPYLVENTYPKSSVPLSQKVWV
jgi:hypothetical protein